MNRIILYLTIASAALLLVSSCGIFDQDPETGGRIQSLVVTKIADGNSGSSSLKLSSTRYVTNPSDVPGCSGVISFTNGKMAYDHIMLSFYFYDDTAIGEELRLERVNFGMPLSSNSADYTSSFTGKMILKEKNHNKAIIRMQDVHFKIAHGEFILNGDLVANK